MTRYEMYFITEIVFLQRLLIINELVCSCDSPSGDFEGRTPKGRGKRSRVPLSDTFKDINERKLRKEMRKQSGKKKFFSSC